FNRGINNAKRSMGSLSTNMQAAGSSMRNFGTNMTAAMLPTALAMGAGISTASSFADSMKEIEVRAGLTGPELKSVEDYALSMGASTMFSGQQAADALLELMTSGDDVETAMARLPQVMDLAAVSGMGLGHSADTITDIMAAFGLETGATEDVVNTLAAAAGSSSAGVSDLGQGFANLGPKAKNMGLSVGDSAAALAVLSENGIKGAQSGTALKSMLDGMTDGMPKTNAAWNELGTSLFDADGNARDFDTVLGELQVALADETPEDQARLIRDLAGSYGQNALAALLASGGIGNMKTAMEGQASAAELAQSKMDTFSGKTNSLQGSIETLMITAITPLINDHLVPLVDSLIPVINGVTDWATANPQATATIVALMGAAVIAGPAIVVLGTVISALGTIVTAAKMAFTLLKAPIIAAKLAKIAYTAVTAAMTGGMGLATIATGSMGTAMLAAAAPILAVGAAIGAVIAAIHTFNTEMANIDASAAAARDSYDTTFSNDGKNQWGEDVNTAAANSLRNQMPALGIFADVLAPHFANAATPEGRATGGPVSGGTPYIVGEEGPELFVPGASGNIVPNGQMGGNQTHINVSGLTIHANSYEQGQAAARGFLELEERMRENG
ncbi:MAG: phage tail tape measure protein, partial [Aggregatilineales bacterium]